METRTIDELLTEIEELENKLLEAEETIEAIRYDKVDALVISTHEGDRIYTLNSADRPYRIFLEKMNEGAVTLSAQGTVLFCNKRFADMVQIPLEQIVGSQIANWVSPFEINTFKNFFEQAGENPREEINFLKPDGSLISLYLSLTKLELDGSEPVSCLVATDLTEKKRNEEILAAEMLARSILEQAGEAIVVCDENLRIIRSSRAVEKLAGKDVLYRHFDNVFPLYDELKNRIPLRVIINNLDDSQVDAALIKSDGQKLNLILNIGVLTDSTNNTIGYVVNLANITKHIEAEEKLTQSLREKTILLKEIHHRVKNNLQIVSSLLRLQSLYVNEDHLLSILNECQNRINSMALIHQKLYESKSFASVNIIEYLKELVIFLSNTFMINPDKVKLQVPDEEISFSIDTAVPLGLIINELVTNSFKHGFADKEKGRVLIEMRAEETGDITLYISDNGRGFPVNLDFYHPGSLGLQLVHSLIEQIDGKIELVSPKKTGSEIKISIPIGNI